MVNVNVRLSSGLAQVTGNARLTLSLPDGATIADLLDVLSQQYPLLTDRLNVALPVIAGQHVTQAKLLTAGEEVALLLPVAGG